jgi:hypothetical protein
MMLRERLQERVRPGQAQYGQKPSLSGADGVAANGHRLRAIYTFRYCYGRNALFRPWRNSLLSQLSD